MVLPSPAQQVTVVAGKDEHVGAILADVRPKDRSEWVCGTGLPLALALRAAFALSDDVRVALDPEGVPLAAWGLDAEEAPTTLNRSVWLVATNRAEKHILSFHRFLGPELNRLHDRAETLYALADNRNEVHLRWLRRIGFERVRQSPSGPLGLPYTLFRRKKCAHP